MNESFLELRRERLGLEEWANQTTLHPLGLVLVLFLGVLLLFVARRSAVLPLVIMACLVAPAQRIVLGGLDFNLLRLMILFGWIRVLLRGDTARFRWQPVDLILILWLVTGTTINTILHGSATAFVNRLGWCYDAAGLYFLFRCLIQSWDDVYHAVRGFVWVSIPVAVAFVVENSTGRNMFSIFGGVPETTILRDGRLRCQGAFAQAILAGCFWASMMPLFLALWWHGRCDRLWSVLGLLCSSIVVITCASSTPLLAIAAGMAAGALFFFRQWLGIIRWGCLAILVATHLAMNAPVWHLLARINLVGGSAGWHRYNLIDKAIEHLDEWVFIGTKSTAHWGRQLFDVTNQYIAEGVRGGLLTLLLFLAVITLSFRSVGRLVRADSENRLRTGFAWALGVSLFMHCMCFIAISYFQQIILVWYLLLAMIASLASLLPRSVTAYADATDGGRSPAPNRMRQIIQVTRR